MNRFQKDLCAQVVRVLSPDLLKPEYRNQPGNPTFGHCYAAAEAVYHLLGGRQAGLVPMHGRDGQGITHWWLRSAEGIIDPTADQYLRRGLNPPYDQTHWV